MLRKILETVFRKKPDEISVGVDRFDPLLMVYISVNNRRRAKIQCVIESNSDILIGDIQHDKDTDYNRGYGSLMMKRLLSYASENQFSYIHGNLSEVDLDHEERLHHFYRKFGFTVNEYSELQGSYYGNIEMYL